MLKIVFFTLKPDQVAVFEAWMAELRERREEVFETFVAEGTRHEVVAILENTNPPVVVYAVEADDFDRAQQVFSQSQFPIDLKHKEVLKATVGEKVPHRVLLDLVLPA